MNFSRLLIFSMILSAPATFAGPNMNSSGNPCSDHPMNVADCCQAPGGGCTYSDGCLKPHGAFCLGGNQAIRNGAKTGISGHSVDNADVAK